MGGSAEGPDAKAVEEVEGSLRKDMSMSESGSGRRVLDEATPVGGGIEGPRAGPSTGPTGVDGEGASCGCRCCGADISL